MTRAHNLSVDYWDLFSRNLGVFSERDQERVREARVMIVGVGGMGGTVAVILARTGFSNFLLVDPDNFEPSNMNRQICCYTDTIGKPKVEVLKEHLQKINPYAKVETYASRPSLQEVEELIGKYRPDVVVAEADDVAFSAKVVRTATNKGIYAITGMPTGFSGYVMAFMPYTKYTPEGLFGLPENLTYEELYKLVESWENKAGRRWYLYKGKWRLAWFKEWREGKKGITQVAPCVWIVAAITASEITKYIVGKWKLIVAPYLWDISLADAEIKVRKYAEGRLFNKYALKAFSIKFFDIGNRWRKAALKIFEWQLKQHGKKEALEDKLADIKYQERKQRISG